MKIKIVMFFSSDMNVSKRDTIVIYEADGNRIQIDEKEKDTEIINRPPFDCIDPD